MIHENKKTQLIKLSILFYIFCLSFGIMKQMFQRNTFLTFKISEL